MALCAKGWSRQVAHEHIRQLSHEAAAQVKVHGKDNDLIERLSRHTFFAPIRDDLPRLLDPRTFIGLAPLQVEDFIGSEVNEALAKYAEHIGLAQTAELKV